METEGQPTGHRAARRAALDRALGLLMQSAGREMGAALNWLAVGEAVLIDLGGQPRQWRQMAVHPQQRREALLADARRLEGLLSQLQAVRQGRVAALLAQVQEQPADDPWAQWTKLILSGDLHPATRERAAQLAALARAYRRVYKAT